MVPAELSLFIREDGRYVGDALKSSLNFIFPALSIFHRKVFASAVLVAALTLLVKLTMMGKTSSLPITWAQGMSLTPS